MGIPTTVHLQKIEILTALQFETDVLSSKSQAFNFDAAIMNFQLSDISILPALH